MRRANFPRNSSPGATGISELLKLRPHAADDCYRRLFRAAASGRDRRIRHARSLFWHWPRCAAYPTSAVAAISYGSTTDQEPRTR